MALGLCRFTNADGGLVDWTYPGPTIDMQSPAAAGAVNGTVYEYYSQSLDMSQWEKGTGAYTAATGVFARTTVLANSNGDTAKISFLNPPQIAVYDLFAAPPAISAILYVAQTITAAQQEQARSNIGASVGIPDVIVEDQKTSGTPGGTPTVGAFQTRALNNLVRNNNSIAALSSNQVTLGAGTYYFSWSAPAFFCSQHKTQLLNVTDSTIAGFGTSEYATTALADSQVTRSIGSCVVTIAATKAFALQHRVTSASGGTSGFGVQSGFGTEVYSRLEITKLG